MSTNEFDIPKEINVHKQIWGKNPDETIMVEERWQKMMKNMVFQELMNLDIVRAVVIWV